ncbi:hypothetical protein E2562_009555 [Oryza meyeriana var. granulata]|uniref:Uncharacterized protein n=1 Tax=Oryza meyeriana var. granulata TaxID=110450 RepID=A0A6G1F5X1_9ORYZ|nr:hypothetical protein E2562_009555 [Oryza meyeriana var. granulata]
MCWDIYRRPSVEVAEEWRTDHGALKEEIGDVCKVEVEWSGAKEEGGNRGEKMEEIEWICGGS